MPPDSTASVGEPASNAALEAALAEGIALFNAGSFWHAHEAWERPWLHASGEMKEFLQGLIQLTAAYHHVQRGTFRGGVRLFDSALRRLESFPPGFCGVDREAVVKSAASHREKIAEGLQVDAFDYPKFR
jgi:uncharacterized protein